MNWVNAGTRSACKCWSSCFTTRSARFEWQRWTHSRCGHRWRPRKYSSGPSHTPIREFVRWPRKHCLSCAKVRCSESAPCHGSFRFHEPLAARFREQSFVERCGSGRIAHTPHTWHVMDGGQSGRQMPGLGAPLATTRFPSVPVVPRPCLVRRRALRPQRCSGRRWEVARHDAGAAPRRSAVRRFYRASRSARSCWQIPLRAETIPPRSSAPAA
jgi:hypothetical protein